MQAREAERALADADLIPCMEAPLGYAKELLEACLSADIPAVLYRDDHCTKGCSPKVQILVREDDAPRVAELLQRRFQEMAAREGTGAPVAMQTDSEHPPCPACGTAAPLVEGACSDCGLLLG